MNKLFLPVISVILTGILVFVPESSQASDLVIKPLAGSKKFMSQADPVIASGKVSDDNGVPLMGVTVLEKGTNKGVTTDAEGSFSMQTT